MNKIYFFFLLQVRYLRVLRNMPPITVIKSHRFLNISLLRVITRCVFGNGTDHFIFAKCLKRYSPIFTARRHIEQLNTSIFFFSITTPGKYDFYRTVQRYSFIRARKIQLISTRVCVFLISVKCIYAYGHKGHVLRIADRRFQRSKIKIIHVPTKNRKKFGVLNDYSTIFPSK